MLRQTKDLLNLDVAATDGDILVMRKSNWWIGHDVLVAPQWIERVSW